MKSWRARCQRVIDLAEVHVITREKFLSDDIMYEFANSVMKGLAVLRAQELGTFTSQPTAVALYDPKMVVSGNSLAVDDFYWSYRDEERPVQVINTAEIARKLIWSMGAGKPGIPGRLKNHLGPSSMECTLCDLVAEPFKTLKAIRGGELRNPTAFATKLGRTVRFMCFADCSNVNDLDEAKAPLYYHAFYSLVRATERETRISPEHRETWGVGLYFVFRHIMEASMFVVDLMTRFKAQDWEGMGLPACTYTRFGLHAGTVFPGYNPVLDAQCYFGSSVVRAARIKPQAAPGTILASVGTT